MDVVSEAIALLAKHKGYAYGLYTDALGKELAANAITRTAVVNEVFTQIITQGYSTQELIEVSRAFLDALSPAETIQMLKDPTGAILLVRVKGFLSCFSEKFNGAARCMKIDAAFGAATGTARAEINTQSNEAAGGNRRKQSPYYTIDAGIILEADAIAVLDKIAPLYFAKVGEKFNVNSGTRDSYHQADAMYDVYMGGDRTLSLYNRQRANELIAIIKKGESRAATVQKMADLIQKYFEKRIIMSDHQNAGAIDISIKGDVGVPQMTAAQQKIMMEIATKVTGYKTLLEKHPPHIHIKFK